MLIGKGRLSIPDYDGRLPAVVMATCVCSLRYAVFTGAVVVGDGCELVKAKAEAGGRLFVDARVEPWQLCACGQALDFSPIDDCALMM